MALPTCLSPAIPPRQHPLFTNAAILQQTPAREKTSSLDLHCSMPFTPCSMAKSMLASHALNILLTNRHLAKEIRCQASQGCKASSATSFTSVNGVQASSSACLTCGPSPLSQKPPHSLSACLRPVLCEDARPGTSHPPAGLPSQTSNTCPLTLIRGANPIPAVRTMFRSRWTFPELATQVWSRWTLPNQALSFSCVPVQVDPSRTSNPAMRGRNVGATQTEPLCCGCVPVAGAASRTSNPASSTCSRAHPIPAWWWTLPEQAMQMGGAFQHIPTHIDQWSTPDPSGAR